MKKVLIANRGEIAVRIIRACRELGLKSVAVHSTADRSSLHTKIADESVCIGPAPSSESYLAIPQIMAAAELTGVDAVHPGYGFLSERHEFADVCHKHGLTFIGPKPEQIETFGNKARARELAKACGVPMLPGSKGILPTVERAMSVASEIGFPVIIKAAAGGGGRGMKIARSREEVKQLFPLAQREAQAAFGNGDCYLERYLENPRHIEVQAIGDRFGRVMTLGERECSIQRRHQKIIEEAPSAILTQKERSEVAGYALRLLTYFGYESLGTVEFLYQDGSFFFMEVNTRVQVEHPVTEMVTGLDLVKEQILLAQGKALEPEHWPKGAFGHAIECRITAEDPWTFAPWPGKVNDFYAPGGPGVRIDSFLYSGYQVPPHYDSLIAKIITYGRDRKECIDRMIRALNETQITGIRTNIPFLQAMFVHERFVQNKISTRFVEEFVAALHHAKSP